MNLVWIVLFLCGDPLHSNYKKYEVFTSSFIAIETIKAEEIDPGYETDYEEGCKWTLYEVNLGKTKIIVRPKKLKVKKEN